MKKLWIDGDSFSSQALEISLNLANAVDMAVEVVADRNIGVNERDFQFTMVEHGSGLTDSVIIEGASSQDIVLTRDLGLAYEMITRGITAMNDRGRIWSEKSLQRRMVDAEIMKAMRAGGLTPHQGLGYNCEDASRFTIALKGLLGI